MKTDSIKLEHFRKQYEDDLMTFRELAKYYGVSPSTIRLYAKNNGINIRKTGNIEEKVYHFTSPFKQEVTNTDLLKELFFKNMSIKEIAKRLHVCEGAASRKIKEMGLTRPKLIVSIEQYDSSHDNEIIKLYNEGKSSVQIGKIVGLSHRSVLNHLKHCGIMRRTLSQSQFATIKKEFPKELENFEMLYDMYVINKMSKKDIAKSVKVSPKTVDRVLRLFNIHVRTNSESKIGQMIGEKHPNWQGGKTELYMRVRLYFQINKIKSIIKRDGHKCQLCGSKKHLHVHHIKTFKSIFDEILREHPNLNVQKDKEELYNIMVNDARMNDDNNLITYCKECHLFKIHGYKKHKK